MPEYGRAAIFEAPLEPMVIREFPVPEPEPGALVVRLKRCNICGSDLHAWHGDYQTRGLGGTLPTILGHEMTGVVHARGKGVHTDSFGEPLQEGDRVVFPYFFFCGRCKFCTSGFPVGCRNLRMAMLGDCASPPHFVGGFADYYYLPPNHVVFKIPGHLGDDLVSGANCALSQVIYGFARSSFRFGDTVVIQGAGGLGIYATAVAREMGAGQVIVLDGVSSRLELARQFGADEVIDIRQTEEKERIQQIRKLTGGTGADVVVEVVGKPEALIEGVQMVRVGGCYIEIGNINLGKMATIDPSRIVFGNKTIVGVSLYEPFALKRAVDFLARTQNKYPYGELLSHSFPLEAINQAFALASERKVNRASIVME